MEITEEEPKMVLSKFCRDISVDEAMSIATKRKYVTQEVLDEFVLPQENRQIVKVLGGRGNNLHEVQSKQNEVFLASMPTRFRKNIWIKRGDFVMVQPIEEGDKVKAEICSILYPHQIQYISDEGLWPEEFADAVKKPTDEMIPNDMLPPSDESEDDDDEEDLDDDDDFVVCNPNRPHVRYDEADDDSEESAEEEDDSQAIKTEHGKGPT